MNAEEVREQLKGMGDEDRAAFMEALNKPIPKGFKCYFTANESFILNGTDVFVAEVTPTRMLLVPSAEEATRLADLKAARQAKASHTPQATLADPEE